MRRLVFLDAALEDLGQILDHIATKSQNLDVALSFTFQLQKQCAKLADLPGTLGTSRPELRPDLRSVTYKGYVILFRYRGDDVEVVNIIEGHRDVERLFSR